jgi:hypothetical protein
MQARIQAEAERSRQTEAVRQAKKMGWHSQGGKHMHTEAWQREGARQAEAQREKQVRGVQVNTGKPQAVVGRLCLQAESSMDAEVYVGGKQMHSRQRHSCWGRQGERGRQAAKQRQASRLAEGSGQLKQAKIDVVRER